MINKSNKFFKLDEEQKINFLSGYYDFHLKNFGHKKNLVNLIETSINAHGGSKKINYEKVSEKFSKKNSAVSLSGFVSKAVLTYQLIELFRDTRFDIPFGRTLDIGCGLGFNLRLLKAWGYIKEAVGIDIYDICSGFDEKKLISQQKKFRLLKYIEKLQDSFSRKSKKEELNLFENLIMSKIPTVRNFSKAYGHRADMSIYDQSFQKKPLIDKLIIGDLYDLDEKFDLVTSFSSLDWFEASEVIPKIYSLTNEGGFFYVWVANWWQSINTTNLFGHFPYAPQRMKKEEFFNYYKEFLPQHLNDVEKAYSYFDPSHPTLADYIDIASDAGFVPLTWKENIFPEILRSNGTALSSLGVQELESDEFNKAYMDIKKNNSNVRKRDMLPYTNSILFYKPQLQNTSDRIKKYESFKKPSVHFRPTGWFGKLIKLVAERFFLQ